MGEEIKSIGKATGKDQYLWIKNTCDAATCDSYQLAKTINDIYTGSIACPRPVDDLIRCHWRIELPGNRFKYAACCMSFDIAMVGIRRFVPVQVQPAKSSSAAMYTAHDLSSQHDCPANPRPNTDQDGILSVPRCSMPYFTE